MEKLGAFFADQLRRGDVVALIGPLGSGKTVFVRGICQKLKCRINAHSPSFTLINLYPGEIEVAHVDLYRLESGFDELGWDDLFQSDRIILIEWADKAKYYLPSKRFDVIFTIVDETTRQVEIMCPDDPGN